MELLSEASAVHACFVYLVEPDGQRLLMRAASEPYSELVGTIELERGEGLAWWAVERGEPAFIKDDALSDPRFSYVPELAEERFQSLVSVPILGREGDAFGAISLHTEAPREFTDEEVEFLVSSSSLVAGAIENARLHAETRHRLRQLELLNVLGGRIAASQTRESLYEVIVDGVGELVQPAACHLYVLDSALGIDQLSHVASAREGAAADQTTEGEEPRTRIGLAELGPELGRARREDETTLHVPLQTGGDLRGLLELRADESHRISDEDADIVETAASQAALALVQLELIEHIREENAIGDFLDALQTGESEEAVRTGARVLGVELEASHIVLSVASASGASASEWLERFERALLRGFAGALVDSRPERPRALVPVRGASRLGDQLVTILEGLDAELRVGVSAECVGEQALRAGFEEAELALTGALVLEDVPPVVRHEDLGVYKYLLRLAAGSPERDAHRAAIATLAAYDRQRSSELVRTLEEYLRHRGSISATASVLYVHQNTLRQRLQRIEELTGMDLRARDWFALDIALRLAALEQDTERIHDVDRLAASSERVESD